MTCAAGLVGRSLLGSAYAAILIPCLAGVVSAQAGLQLELVAKELDACMTQSELSAQIAQRTGGLEASGETPLRMRVSIRARGAQPGFAARVSVLDRAGQVRGVRELTSEEEDCRALDTALVLVVSAMLGVELPPPARAAGPEPEPELPRQPRKKPVLYSVEVMSPPERPSADAPRFTRSEDPAATEPWRLDMELSVRAMSGLMPGAAGGLAAGVSLRSGALQLLLGALIVPRGHSQIGSSHETDFNAVLGEVGACAIAARPARGVLGFCAEAQLGAISVYPRGFWVQRASQQLAVQAIPSVRLELPLSGGLSLQGAGGAALPLRSVTFSYVDDGEQRRQFHAVQLGLWAELGLALRLFQ